MWRPGRMTHEPARILISRKQGYVDQHHLRLDCGSRKLMRPSVMRREENLGTHKDCLEGFRFGGVVAA
jgi:hypothetical protein